MARDHVAGGNLFRNVIGLLGEGRPTLEYDRLNTFDPFWEARGIRQIRLIGKALAEDIGGDGYDYVAYDSSLSWSPSRADVAQREATAQYESLRLCVPEEARESVTKVVTGRG